ncbi:MAG: hypothetical protein N2491_09035 [Negativicutes bacterium]|nr:hypothetical protein [Negativicutes bacterium]
MSQIVASHLKAGYIFGDHAAGEYVYMPAGEIGADDPVCVIETSDGERRDISLEQAVELIARLTLKRIRHPRLGNKSC